VSPGWGSCRWRRGFDLSLPKVIVDEFTGFIINRGEEVAVIVIGGGFSHRNRLRRQAWQWCLKELVMASGVGSGDLLYCG
jgi:hypothetical protein